MLPVFKNSDDIIKFLNSEKDVWCRPMIEEFVDTCELYGEDVNVNDLNKWLEEELRSFQKGYENYLDNKL